jgi:hypothetical protein
MGDYVASRLSPRGLSAAPLASLEHLDVSECSRMNDADLVAALPYSLRSLVVSGLRFSDEDVRRLPRQGLRSLGAAYCVRITPEVFEHLPSTLTLLDLTGLSFSPEELLRVPSGVVVLHHDQL